MIDRRCFVVGDMMWYGMPPVVPTGWRAGSVVAFQNLSLLQESRLIQQDHNFFNSFHHGTAVGL